MTGAERGFLLLTSCLGNPQRKPLTTAQFRQLTDRMRRQPLRSEDRELDIRDLLQLGYNRTMAQRILDLLSEVELLEHYLRRGEKVGCVPLTRITSSYPMLLHKRLGMDAPGCLWIKGNVELLQEPAIALVGSRDMLDDNRLFAAEVGRQAALQGYALISGNARGADKTAQESCLAAGGKVICVVADELTKHPVRDNVLYISEDSFDSEFSSQRALSRNRVIHCLGLYAFVAQSRLGMGGTWDGTVKNLKHQWSPVFCFADGSKACEELTGMGATAATVRDLSSFYDLKTDQANFLTADD